jgi:hypothetical protein
MWRFYCSCIHTATTQNVKVKCTVVQALRLCTGCTVKCTVRQALRLCTGCTVKCTLVQALRLCTSRTVYRKSWAIALTFHDHDTRRGWGVSVTPRPLFTPRKDPVSIVQEAGWTPGTIWTGAENLATARIRFPDRPVRSQSLYWLQYPAHMLLSNSV